MGVWGRDRVRSGLGNGIAGARGRSQAVAERLRYARCAVLLRLAWIGVVWAEISVAVPWGLVGGVFCWACVVLCAVGISREHVVWVVCSVAVPLGLVGGRVPLGVSCGAVPWGLVGGGASGFPVPWGLVGGVILGVSGVVVPWGLVGDMLCLVVLGFAVSCQVVSCRAMSGRVVSRRVASCRGTRLLSTTLANDKTT